MDDDRDQLPRERIRDVVLVGVGCLVGGGAVLVLFWLVGFPVS